MHELVGKDGAGQQAGQPVEHLREAQAGRQAGQAGVRPGACLRSSHGLPDGLLLRLPAGPPPFPARHLGNAPLGERTTWATHHRCRRPNSPASRLLLTRMAVTWQRVGPTCTASRNTAKGLPPGMRRMERTDAYSSVRHRPGGGGGGGGQAQRGGASGGARGDDAHDGTNRSMLLGQAQACKEEGTSHRMGGGGGGGAQATA